MAEILQEFLIPVSFKVDAASEARMKDSIRTATLQSNLLADAIEGALKSFGQVMRKVAENLDQMFYASQRTAASVENIKAFGYAASQLGSSIGEANSALEAFGKFLRSNPGSYNLLEKIGIRTKDGGQIRDTGRLLEDLGAKLATMPRYLQQQYASLFGISDKVLFAITSPEFRKKAEERRAILQRMGLDETKAAEASRGFAQALGRVKMVMAAIATKVEAAIIDRFGDSLKSFGDFLIRNGDDIAKTLEEVASAVAKVGSEFIKGITGTDNLDDAFKKILGTIRELSKWVEKLVDQISDLIRMVNKFGEDSGITWLLNRLGYWGAPNENPGTGPAGGAGGDTRNWWQRHAPGFLGGKEAPGGGEGGGPAGATRASGSLAKNQQEAYAAARAEGLSDKAARALVANMSGESLKNPSDHHWDVSHMSQGIVQWDPQRAEAIRRQFGKLPKDMSVAEQTKAAIWEINNNPRFRRTRDALAGNDHNTMIDALVRNYEVPANPGGEVAKRTAYYNGLNVRDPNQAGVGAIFSISPAQAETDRRWKEHLNQPRRNDPFGGLPAPDAFRRPLDGGVNQTWNRSITNNMSMKTDIKVDGAADPNTTAALIGSRVDNVHRGFANTIRNFQGAAQ